jgi:type IV secretion system protein TrbC
MPAQASARRTASYLAKVIRNGGFSADDKNAPQLQKHHQEPRKISFTFAPDVATGSTDSPELQTKGADMQTSSPITRPHLRRSIAHCRRWAIPSLMFLASLPVYAQTTGSDPWDNAVNVLKTAFTGTIAQGLSLVAIVVGGLMFAYGEGQSKKMLAGIVFGVGMAIGAVNFMAWLFPS